MGQQCLNSFVLTNIDLIETPGMQEAIENNIKAYRGIIQEQIFLQEQGVSFSYSDGITYIERADIIDEYANYIQEKNRKIQEATNKAKK